MPRFDISVIPDETIPGKLCARETLLATPFTLNRLDLFAGLKTDMLGRCFRVPATLAFDVGVASFENGPSIIGPLSSRNTRSREYVGLGGRASHFKVVNELAR